jgi:hypothetical protein
VCVSLSTKLSLSLCLCLSLCLSHSLPRCICFHQSKYACRLLPTRVNTRLRGMPLRKLYGSRAYGASTKDCLLHSYPLVSWYEMHTYICTCIHTHTHTHIYIYIYIYVCVCMCICICICIRVCGCFVDVRVHLILHPHKKKTKNKKTPNRTPFSFRATIWPRSSCGATGANPSPRPSPSWLRNSLALCIVLC